MSSDLAMFVSSSIEIWLSSQIATRLPSFWCAASALTSWLTPSSRSPSEQTAYTTWSNELVPAWPVRVGRVVPHDPLEEKERRRGQAHRRARVAVAGLFHRVHGQNADRVDRAAVKVGPIQCAHSDAAPRACQCRPAAAPVQ